MVYRYDILLRAGTVVDPTNKRNGVMDVAISEGSIIEVAPGLNPTLAREVFDLRGLHVLPGISAIKCWPRPV